MALGKRYAGSNEDNIRLTEWYKLDNAAMIYQPSTNKMNADNFRISVTLKDRINKKKLEIACNKAIKHFPSMAVRMRTGLFWNYFDSNDAVIVVKKETEPPCSKIEINSNNAYHFKILYYKNRLSLEMFHAVTDGTGAMVFLKKILSYYILEENMSHYENDSVKLSEIEDSYLKHYKKNDKMNLQLLKRAKKITGKPIAISGTMIDQGIISTKSLLSIAKENNLTLTQFLLSIYIRALYNSLEKKSNKPITVMVPVNLRNIFSSDSLRNFTYFITVTIEPETHLTEHLIFDKVKQQMREGLDKKKLLAPIHFNVKLSQSILFRILPYAIKHNILKMARGLYNENGMTSMLTNLGSIVVDENLSNEILGFDFILGSASKKMVNMAVCSYNDNMVISISRNVIENKVANEFFNILTNEYDLSISRVSNE